MLSLLDLPAEIRNQIWDLCVVSPTGTVQAVNRREAFRLGYPNSCSPSGPFFYLLVDETNHFISNSGVKTCTKRPRIISLSLPRTCRQIYYETNELFWTCNIFYFCSPYSLMQAFNRIGQYPFRQIVSIRLQLCPALGNELAVFDRTIRLLIKQTKFSLLRYLELVLSLDSIIHMVQLKNGHNFYFGTIIPGLKLTYESVLASFRDALHLHHVEKKLVIRDEHNLRIVESVHELAVAVNFEGILREIQEIWVREPQSESRLVCDAKDFSSHTIRNTYLSE